MSAIAPLVRPGDVSDAEHHAVEAGCLVADQPDTARFALSGPGRVACLQGLVTCDVQAAPAGAALFGALLTNKGMILTPLWIVARSDTLLVEAPGDGAAALEETFRRTLPPRLCRWENLTSATVTLGQYGPAARAWSGAWPSVMRGLTGFESRMSADEAAVRLEAALAAGAVRASGAVLERARIAAGIPRLGAEIDARTLPQEVRLDELGAVSFTKGCYVGQETVARLHYRGHANRRLVALELDGEPAAVPAELSLAGVLVGRLTSAAWSPGPGRWVGLGVIRRAVHDGAALELPGGSGAATVRLDAWRPTA